jgi:hypothetical protein
VSNSFSRSSTSISRHEITFNFCTVCDVKVIVFSTIWEVIVILKEWKENSTGKLGSFCYTFEDWFATCHDKLHSSGLHYDS